MSFWFPNQSVSSGSDRRKRLKELRCQIWYDKFNTFLDRAWGLKLLRFAPKSLDRWYFSIETFKDEPPTFALSGKLIIEVASSLNKKQSNPNQNFLPDLQWRWTETLSICKNRSRTCKYPHWIDNSVDGKGIIWLIFFS